MPRSPDPTRNKILQAAYGGFRRKGFFRIGVDEIAAAAGITKRTLYYHFKSKDELLAAVLDSQRGETFAGFQNFGIDVSGPAPEVVIDKIFKGLVAWSSKPDWSGSGYTRLAIELADLPGHPARAVARRHKATMDTYIGSLLEQAGVAEPYERAREIALLIEGAIVKILIHGDRSFAASGAAAAKRLIATAPKADLRRPSQARAKLSR
jgi:AcrR family transcriptional regulator